MKQLQAEVGITNKKKKRDKARYVNTLCQKNEKEN